MLITKQVKFEAAHRLLGWPHSKCHRQHGHSYVVEVTVRGEPETTGAIPGAVLDFTALGQILKVLVFDKYDHQDLNKVLDEDNTTAEFLAQIIYHELRNPVEDSEPNQVSLHNVRVYETATAWADYGGPDGL